MLILGIVIDEAHVGYLSLTECRGGLNGINHFSGAVSSGKLYMMWLKPVAAVTDVNKR